jgi:hypothetical protein
MMPIAPFVLGVQLLLVADQPPQLDVETSCQAAQRAGVEGRTRDACMREEDAALGTLRDKWKDFSAAQQARCGTLVRMGGPPSYVELLTCLEMAAQADKIPDSDALKPPRGTGSGTIQRE